MLTSSLLASLRFFEVAARLQSFKQAARELHVTQGAVSQQIKQLEQALGCNLFNRLPRQLALTEEGRQFAEVVRRALADIEHAAAAIAGAQLEGAIHIRVGPSLALRWLVPRLGDFYRRYPEIKLHISAEFGSPELASQRYNLTLEMGCGLPTGKQRIHLMAEYLTPVCSPAWLEQHPFLHQAADLARCTLLHDAAPWDKAAGDAEWRYWLNASGAERVDSHQGQFFNQSDLALTAALAGQGVALGRASLLGDLVSSGRLVTPFDRQIESPAAHYICAHGKGFDIPKIRALVDWLLEQAGLPP